MAAEIYKGIFVTQPYDNRSIASYEARMPRLILPVAIPGEPGVGQITYVHRGDREDGFWIPEEWLSADRRKVEAAERVRNAVRNSFLGYDGMTLEGVIEAAAAAHRADVARMKELAAAVDSHKGQVKAKQKIIEEQAGKIRTAMMELQGAMSWADGANMGIVGLVKEMIKHHKSLKHQGADRDKYGNTLSKVRELCHAALYGAGQPRPPSADAVDSTTDMVKAVIAIAESNVEALRRARIEDSERMGAEMSARRNFLGRLWKIYRPGSVISVSMSDEQCRGCEDEIVGWLVDATTKLSQRSSVDHAEYERMQEEFLAIRAELKSTGHRDTGAKLDVLVDRAIDAERDRHHDTLERISKALDQAWAARPGLVNPYRDWCSFLVDVITYHWQPKPRGGLFDVGDVAERAVDREEGKSTYERLDVLEKCVAQFTAPYSIEDYAAYKHQSKD